MCSPGNLFSWLHVQNTLVQLEFDELVICSVDFDKLTYFNWYLFAWHGSVISSHFIKDHFQNFLLPGYLAGYFVYWIITAIRNGLTTWNHWCGSRTRDTPPTGSGPPAARRRRRAPAAGEEGVEKYTQRDSKFENANLINYIITNYLVCTDEFKGRPIRFW